MSVPTDTVLYDISQGARVLLAREEWRGGIYGVTPGESRERDLSLFDFSIASDLSADGKTPIFYEFGEAGGSLSASFLRKTDGTSVVRLADGFCGALSRDTKRVICTTPEFQLNEVPTGTGEVRHLTHDKLNYLNGAEWFPDEKRLLFAARKPGHVVRFYVQDLPAGQPRAITPEGASLFYRLSPDGKQLAVAMDPEYRTLIFPTDGGESRPVPGTEAGEVPIAWTPDNGDSYVYSINRRLDVLYLVEGLP